jgi:hypothetical protein
MEIKTLYALPAIARMAGISIATANKRKKTITPFAILEGNQLPVFDESAVELFKHKPGTRGVRLS